MRRIVDHAVNGQSPVRPIAPPKESIVVPISPVHEISIVVAATTNAELRASLLRRLTWNDFQLREAREAWSALAEISKLGLTYSAGVVAAMLKDDVARWLTSAVENGDPKAIENIEWHVERLKEDQQRIRAMKPLQALLDAMHDQRCPPERRAEISATLASELRVTNTNSNVWAECLTTVDDTWLAETPPPRRYLMTDTRTGKGAIPAEGAALFVAAGGVGKSMVTIAAALAIATGTALFEVLEPEEPGRALIISAEEPHDELRRRIHATAKARGIASIPKGAIDIIDIHNKHRHLLTRDGEPTKCAEALIEMVRERGPYALVVLDPIAKMSGANIDKDNSVATALITTFEQVATAARGLALGVHHTSQEARRSKIIDATAARGATGLTDSARLVLVAQAEEIEHEDLLTHERLGEIVTITRAKANHIRRWHPIQLRRGDEGVLLPITERDAEIVAAARKTSQPAAKREADRTARTTARQAEEDAAVIEIVSAEPGLGVRALRTKMRLKLGKCSDHAADDAVERAIAAKKITRKDGKGNAVLHYPY